MTEAAGNDKLERRSAIGAIIAEEVAAKRIETAGSGIVFDVEAYAAVLERVHPRAFERESRPATDPAASESKAPRVDDAEAIEEAKGASPPESEAVAAVGASAPPPSRPRHNTLAAERDDGAGAVAAVVALVGTMRSAKLEAFYAAHCAEFEEAESDDDQPIAGIHLAYDFKAAARGEQHLFLLHERELCDVAGLPLSKLNHENRPVRRG